MVTKKGRQNRLKIGYWQFWNKFGTFDREINKYEKDILTDDYNYHDTQHIKSCFDI